MILCILESSLCSQWLLNMDSGEKPVYIGNPIHEVGVNCLLWSTPLALTFDILLYP